MCHLQFPHVSQNGFENHLLINMYFFIDQKHQGPGIIESNHP